MKHEHFKLTDEAPESSTVRSKVGAAGKILLAGAIFVGTAGSTACEGQRQVEQINPEPTPDLIASPTPTPTPSTGKNFKDFFYSAGQLPKTLRDTLDRADKIIERDRQEEARQAAAKKALQNKDNNPEEKQQP